MNFTPELLQVIIAKLIILILSVCVHEFGHAFVADRLGDPLPRSEGRVTLNPFSHVHPVGTLLMPVIVLFATQGQSSMGFGQWVNTQPWRYTRKVSQRTGIMLVSLAGPLMNLFFGLFICIVLAIVLKAGVAMPFRVLDYTVYAIQLNFLLMFFNLIPARPLDGGAVAPAFMPDRMARKFEANQHYGIFVVAAVMMIPALGAIFRWPATQLYHGVAHLLGLPS